jgi:excisionase family DNA binding protein
MKKQATVKPSMVPAVMTVREVAAYLRVHPSTIYRLLKQGKIPAFRIDSDWRFHVKTIDEWRLRMEAHPPVRSSSKREDKKPMDHHPNGSSRAGV